METVVELTSSFGGVYRFYICPEADSSDLQACLWQHPLPLAAATSKEQFQVAPSDGKRIMRISYQLPVELSCDRCVILWRLVNYLFAIKKINTTFLNTVLCTYDLYSPVHNVFGCVHIHCEGKWEGVGP
jgi:hypothetical protein